MIVVGIDPGTETGYATWDPIGYKLCEVLSLPIHRALRHLESLSETHAPGSLLVVFEDCRNLRMVNGRNWKKDQAVLQGVGSVKRDCSIWEDFLRDRGIPYHTRKPTPASLKWKAEKFQRITGWASRTNNHARDAAVIVYGMNRPIAEGLVRAWLQEQERRPTSTGKSSTRRSPPAAAPLPSCPTVPGASTTRS